MVRGKCLLALAGHSRLKCGGKITRVKTLYCPAPLPYPTSDIVRIVFLWFLSSGSYLMPAEAKIEFNRFISASTPSASRNFVIFGDFNSSTSCLSFTSSVVLMIRQL